MRGKREIIARIRKRINKNILSLAFCSLLVLSMISCDNRGEVYFQYKELKNSDWAVDEVLIFEIDSSVIEKNKPYNILVEITNNVSYPYQNLWLSVQYCQQESVLMEEEYELTLADEAGEWNGSGFASLFQSSHRIVRRIVFPNNTQYTIKLRHRMKDKKLHGIERVGVKIQQTK